MLFSGPIACGRARSADCRSGEGAFCKAGPFFLSDKLELEAEGESVAMGNWSFRIKLREVNLSKLEMM